MATSCVPGATNKLTGTVTVDGAWRVDARSLLSVSSYGGGGAWGFESKAKAIPVRPQRSRDGFLAGRGARLRNVRAARGSVRLRVRRHIGPRHDGLRRAIQQGSVGRTASLAVVR